MWPFTRAYPECRVEDVTGETFDYIIVGGGTAGCVLASRLSEDPTVSVLLVERGGVRDHVLSRIPLMSQNFSFPWLQAVSDRFSEPIKACFGKKIQLWGAEGIGGTSRINVMLLTRGLPAGYNEWAEMGLKDWAWDKVEPYFKRMENARGHTGNEHRGHEGPLESRQFVGSFKFYPYLEAACRALGLPVEQDCNSPDASAQGYFHLDATIDQHGQRLSTYRAYLNKQISLERQDRLKICTGVVASRLEVDSRRQLVTGVHLRPVSSRRGSHDIFIRARREVVVCSGTFRTPQLLMLSGIGPKEHLQTHGIPSTHDLPAVGVNLYDHYTVPVVVEPPLHDTLESVTKALCAIWNLILYFIFGVGLMAQPSTLATVFLRTTSLDADTMTVRARQPRSTSATTGEYSSPDCSDNMASDQPRNIPNVEIMINPINCISRDLSHRSALTFHTTLVQPHSAGRVELASTDPLEHPRVHHPMLTDERDWETMRAATRFTMRLAEEFASSGYPYPAPLIFAPGMDREELELVTTETPSLTAAPADEKAAKSRPSDLRRLKLEPITRSWNTVSDAEIDDYARRVAVTSLHFSCTCRMSVDEKDGVVDQRLRVHGLLNLRIADASVFPKIPSAHTMAPTVMVAERCADFLKKDWSERKTK